MTILLQSLSWFFGHVSLSFARRLGRGIGWMAWLFSFRKKEVSQRIVTCLDVSASEAGKIQRRMYRNLGMTVAEFFRMPYMDEEDVRGIITFENADELRKDHRYIGVVAHTGNWELMGSGAPVCGLGPLNIVVKSLKPPSLDAWVHKVRSTWGTRVHDRKGSTRNLLKVFKAEEPLGFILDQNAKKNWGVFVDFFGEKACTSDGAAQFAAISGYTLYPIFCRRDSETLNLIVEVGEKLPGPTDRSPEEITRVTALCTEKIEAFIRKYPDQWIWMHRRWRTKDTSGVS